MKIVLAADGSPYSKKAFAFISSHLRLDAGQDELIVVNVQPPLPARVKSFAGAEAVSDWHRDEARKVLEPMEELLASQAIPHRTRWMVGHAAEEIVHLATEEKADLIVMGTHGHGMLGRVMLGSVAQKVLHLATVPVLLAK